MRCNDDVGGHVPASHFKASTSEINAHASRTRQRAEEIQERSRAVGSNSMGEGVLSSLAGSTVGSINATQQRAGAAMDNLAGRFTTNATNERSNASAYDEVESDNEQRFTNLMEGVHDPGQSGAHTVGGGGGGRGGGGGGNRGGGGPTTPSSDGGWDGPEGLHLTPEQNAAADAFLAHSAQSEPGISSVMQQAAGQTGANMIGFDHRLKTPDSFKRKLAQYLRENPNRTVDQGLANMKDSVRYTMSYPGEGTAYADGVNSTLQQFRDAGYENVKFKNTWEQPRPASEDSPGSMYQGINSFWRDPNTNQTFEVQFHTPQSFQAKEGDTHDLYEEQRLLPETDPRYVELQQQQKQVFDNVPRPVGASGLQWTAPGGE